MLQRLLALAITATLLAIGNSAPAAGSQESYVPPLMRACSSQHPIDCIEGITITNTKGVSAKAVLTGETHRPSWLREDEAFDLWALRFSNTESLVVYVESRMRPDGQPLCWIESDTCSNRSGAIDMGVVRLDGEFEVGYTFVVRLRVKDFVPGGIGGKAKDVSFQNLASTSGIRGARTLVLRGTNLPWDWYEISEANPVPPGERERADGVGTIPIFWLWDSNNDALWRIPRQCRVSNGNSIPHFMFTAYNMGSPEWDPATMTLSVTLESAHLAADGSKNRGYYEIFLPKAFASCMWGVNPSRATKASVEIRDSASGEAQVAVVTQEASNAGLKIVASNFHYSKPTISISLAQKQSSANNVKQITCAKSQARKTVRAVAPKCPSGWKRIN